MISIKWIGVGLWTATGIANLLFCDTVEGMKFNYGLTWGVLMMHLVMKAMDA